MTPCSKCGLNLEAKMACGRNDCPHIADNMPRGSIEPTAIAWAVCGRCKNTLVKVHTDEDGILTQDGHSVRPCDKCLAEITAVGTTGRAGFTPRVVSRRSEIDQLQAGIRQTKIDMLVRECVSQFDPRGEFGGAAHLRQCEHCRRQVASFVLKRWRQLAA